MLFDEAAIVSSRLGMTIKEVYVWMYTHDESLKRVKIFPPAQVIECIEKNKPLEWAVAGSALSLAKESAPLDPYM